MKEIFQLYFLIFRFCLAILFKPIVGLSIENKQFNRSFILYKTSWPWTIIFYDKEKIYKSFRLDSDNERKECKTFFIDFFTSKEKSLLKLYENSK